MNAIGRVLFDESRDDREKGSSSPTSSWSLP
jgi:hypothetical protein